MNGHLTKMSKWLFFCVWNPVIYSLTSQFFVCLEELLSSQAAPMSFRPVWFLWAAGQHARWTAHHSPHPRTKIVLLERLGARQLFGMHKLRAQWKHWCWNVQREHVSGCLTASVHLSFCTGARVLHSARLCGQMWVALTPVLSLIQREVCLLELLCIILPVVKLPQKRIKVVCVSTSVCQGIMTLTHAAEGLGCCLVLIQPWSGV